MLKKIVVSVLIVITLQIGVFSLAFADGAWEFNAGAIANVGPQYIGSDEPEYYIFPAIEATYHIGSESKFFVGTNNGLGLESKFGFVTLGIGAGYRYGIYGPDLGFTNNDKDDLEGMHDPQSTTTFKAHIKFTKGEWFLRVDYDQGLSNTNEGGLTKGELGIEHFFSNAFIATFSAQTTYADEKFLNDYFGVSLDEIRPLRTEFTPTSGAYNYGVNLQLVYMITEQHVLYTQLLINNLDKEIAESSLVKTDLQPEFSFGYLFYF